MVSVGTMVLFTKFPTPKGDVVSIPAIVVANDTEGYTKVFVMDVDCTYFRSMLYAPTLTPGCWSFLAAAKPDV